MTQTAAESPAKKGDPASTQRDGHRLLAVVHRSIRYLKIPCKPHHAHCANAIPIQIELVPCETVTGRLRFGVVVIMPALPEGQHGDPKAVSRVVVSLESLRPPHMRGGIDEPC